MEWTENPQLADELLREIDKDLERDLPIPTVTELIYCLTKGYWDRTNRIARTPKTTCMFAIGVGLGDVMLRRLRTEVAGECEGIHYHVDFLMFDDRMGELKSTRYNTKKPPHEWSSGWHKQLLSYMKVRETLEAVYAVMFVIPAEFKTWEVVATEQEVDQNWTWMQARRAIYMGHMDDTPTMAGLTMPTPFKYNESWECKGCQYETLCEAEVATMKAKDAHAEHVMATEEEHARTGTVQVLADNDEGRDRAIAEESAQQQTSHEGWGPKEDSE